MKRSCGSILLALTIVLTACGSPTPVATPSTAPLTQPATDNTSVAQIVTASAVVAPVQTSEMGFLISATVKEVAVKTGDEVRAGQAMIVLNTPALEFAVAGAQAAVRSAQAEADLQKYAHKTFNGSRFVSLSGPPELRQVADARLQQAQAALELARASLAQGTLLAPFAGTVVAINVVPGELVQPGQVVAVIANLDHLQIETTDLGERQIAGVQVGQPASAHIKAFDRDFKGRVAAIAPLGEKSGGDVVYKVTIELEAPPAGLMWGMSADVGIQTR